MNLLRLLKLGDSGRHQSRNQARLGNPVLIAGASDAALEDRILLSASSTDQAEQSAPEKQDSNGTEANTDKERDDDQSSDDTASNSMVAGQTTGVSIALGPFSPDIETNPRGGSDVDSDRSFDELWSDGASVNDVLSPEEGDGAADGMPFLPELTDPLPEVPTLAYETAAVASAGDPPTEASLPPVVSGPDANRFQAPPPREHITAPRYDATPSFDPHTNEELDPAPDTVQHLSQFRLHQATPHSLRQQSKLRKNSESSLPGGDDGVKGSSSGRSLAKHVNSIVDGPGNLSEYWSVRRVALEDLIPTELEKWLGRETEGEEDEELQADGSDNGDQHYAVPVPDESSASFQQQLRYAWIRLDAAASGDADSLIDSTNPPEPPEIGGIWKRLRFECNPRGPPQDELILRSEFSRLDGKTTQLTQLRHSIAPRGPSVASVQ